MTVIGWIVCIVTACTIAPVGLVVYKGFEKVLPKVITIIVTLGLIVGIFFGVRWYYQNTASGQRAMVDQKSEFANGLNRTITIYTANGDKIAQYSGIIDIKGNDGGYVLFDYNGKRYTYYNCFVESIAEIE